MNERNKHWNWRRRKLLTTLIVNMTLIWIEPRTRFQQVKGLANYAKNVQQSLVGAALLLSLPCYVCLHSLNRVAILICFFSFFFSNKSTAKIIIITGECCSQFIASNCAFVYKKSLMEKKKPKRKQIKTKQMGERHMKCTERTTKGTEKIQIYNTTKQAKHSTLNSQSYWDETKQNNKQIVVEHMSSNANERQKQRWNETVQMPANVRKNEWETQRQRERKQNGFNCRLLNKWQLKTMAHEHEMSMVTWLTSAFWVILQ